MSLRCGRWLPARRRARSGPRWILPRESRGSSGGAVTLLDGGDSRPVHFMGIAGAGMSALAELFRRRGMG
jgi:hypothetical protein